MAYISNRIIHRFIRDIADYEVGGKCYSQILPADTQVYAVYDKPNKKGLYFVIGDGIHTYLEIRDGYGKSEVNTEYRMVPADVQYQPYFGDVQLSKLKDRDLLIYDKVLEKFINKPFDDVLEEEQKRQSDYMSDRKLRKLSDWLYEIYYEDDFDEDYSLDYFKNASYPTMGLCSSVRNGNYYGRNYDWLYDYAVSFLIRCPKTEKRKHASIGVCGGQPVLTKDVVASGVYKTEYKVLPYFTLDGINDAGVICNSNVVSVGDNPDDPRGDRPNRTTGTHPGKKDVSCMMMVRYILDNAGSVEEALALFDDINLYAWFDKTQPEELHWMIADENRTVIVEFVENKMRITEDWSKKKPIMTNFYLTGWNGNTNDICMQTNTEQGIPANPTLTKHAMGTERYKTLYDGYSTSGESVDRMLQLMQTVFYRKGSYDKTLNPAWYSEYLAYYEKFGDITIDTPTTDENLQYIFDTVMGIKEEEDRTGTRTAKTWQTVSQSVYDFKNKSITLIVQEDLLTRGTYYLNELPPTENIDGGDARGIQENTLDGGNAGTEVWDLIIDGGNAGTVQGLDGGDSDTRQTTVEECGSASTTVFTKYYDGGNLTNLLKTN